VMMLPMNDRVSIDPRVCHGKPVIRGTRVLVSTLLGALAGGDSIGCWCQAFCTSNVMIPGKPAVQHALISGLAKFQRSSMLHVRKAWHRAPFTGAARQAGRPSWEPPGFGGDQRQFPLSAVPQHFLYFLPDPQTQGSLRPIFGLLFGPLAFGLSGCDQQLHQLVSLMVSSIKLARVRQK